MMQHYISTSGEIIEPVIYGINVYDSAEPAGLVHAADDAVPIAERFTPEFVATLRPYDPEAEPNPPELEPAPVPAMTAEQATVQRDSLLAFATLRIAPLQDAVDLDEATVAEIAALKAWKQYRVALNRIQLQPGFPGAIDWPVAPEA